MKHLLFCYVAMAVGLSFGTLRRINKASGNDDDATARAVFCVAAGILWPILLVASPFLKKALKGGQS